MTLNQFEELSEKDKKDCVAKAEKLSMRLQNFTKVSLFKIDNFFVETRKGMVLKLTTTFKSYSDKDLPEVYTEKLQSLWW